MSVTEVSTAYPMDEAARRRCLAHGLSPELEAPSTVADAREIEDRQRRSAIAPLVEPLCSTLSRRSSREQLMILSGPDGRVLWRRGAPRIIDEAESIGFVEGADWSESSVGTNAISQVLRSGRPARMVGAQHFAWAHGRWSCMAAPLIDPLSGVLLGVLDVSGRREEIDSEVASMVETLAQMSTELLRAGVLGAVRDRECDEQAQEVPRRRIILLDGIPRVEGPDGTRLLSRRRAETLALLLGRSRGWTAGELAAELYGDAGRPGTVRTEVHRLRQSTSLPITSDPYALDDPHVSSDVRDLEEALAAGDAENVLRLLNSPPLPQAQSEVLTARCAWWESEAARVVADYGSLDQQRRWRGTDIAMRQTAS